jgi:cytoskeleton protein RodZ
MIRDLKRPELRDDIMAYPESARTAPLKSIASTSLDLSRLRQLAGRSLEEIASSTKISIRFLRAIECEEFEKLPGGIFSTSYLRQYAIAIGYDEAALVAHYRVKMNLPLESVGDAPPENGNNRNRLDRWLKIPVQASRQL